MMLCENVNPRTAMPTVTTLKGPCLKVKCHREGLLRGLWRNGSEPRYDFEPRQ